MKFVSFLLLCTLLAGCPAIPNPQPNPEPDHVLPDEEELAPVSVTPPKAIINGPSSVSAGDIIDLSALACTGSPKYFRWEVTPQQHESKLVIRDGGKTATLPSFPGEYRVTLLVGNSGGIDVAHHDIRVSGCSPSPSPTPNPTPNPTPPSPDVTPDVNPGQYGIANIAYLEALRINSSTRPTTARKIADEAEGLSAKIVAGGVRGAINITSEISDALDRATDDVWDPWRKVLTDRLKALYYTEKKLKSDNDWAVMLTEISQAMRKVQ